VKHLVRLNLEGHLPFNLFSTCKSHMQQDHPTACHSEIHFSSILAGGNLLGVGEHRSHSRVRHVPLCRHLRPAHRPPRRILQGEKNGLFADMSWFRSEPSLDRHARPIARAGASRCHDQKRQNECQLLNAAAPRHQAAMAVAFSADRHTHVHVGRTVSSAGGNMW
jgi:hypothetical protein